MLYVRCFVELALASNAPTPLKTQVNIRSGQIPDLIPDLIPDRLCVYFPTILHFPCLKSF